MADNYTTGRTEVLRSVRELRACCVLHEGEVCRRFGLTPVEVSCLLGFSARPVGVGGLAERLGLSASRTSRLVDALVRRRLVRRVGSQADRRALSLSLTPKGRERRGRLVSAMRSCERRLLRQLGVTRARGVVRQLKLLSAAFRSL
jgi:DNA-binding MarR family transcriptional regulator